MAFTLMDANKDGFIDKSDLRTTYAEMGSVPPESVLDEMLKEAPGPINFTTFLTLFGDRLTGCDPEDAVMNAFRLYDRANKGHIPEDQFIAILENKRGEPLDEEEMRAMYKGNPPINKKQLDYHTFVKMMTAGGQDQLDKVNAANA